MFNLSDTIKDGYIKQSPIRKIMEVADPKNIVKLGLNPDDIISFAGGWVNHEAPEGLREEYKKIVNDKNLFHRMGGYSPTEGDFEFRTIIAEMDKEIYDNPNLTADNIIVGQSSTQLLFGLFITLLNPKDRVLVFDPTYANYLEQIHVCQEKESIITLKVFDEESWTFMRDENKILSSLKEIIKKDKPKAILISSPDNPTGQILSDKFVEEMLKIALKLGVFVLIDNAYRAQYFTKQQPKQFSFSPENYENLITIHSNSKWCRGLGRRLGWIEANKKIITAMKIIQQTMILCPDTMHQFAMTNYIKRGLEDGSLKRYLEKTRKNNDRIMSKIS